MLTSVLTGAIDWWIDLIKIFFERFLQFIHVFPYRLIPTYWMKIHRKSRSRVESWSKSVKKQSRICDHLKMGNFLASVCIACWSTLSSCFVGSARWTHGAENPIFFLSLWSRLCTNWRQNKWVQKEKIWISWCLIELSCLFSHRNSSLS